MCLSRYPVRVALLSLAFACSGAWAQPTGLRLAPQFGLHEGAVGLKLRFVESNSAMFTLPSDSYLAEPATLAPSRSTSKALIADWQLNTSGLRASAGLVLRYRNSGISGDLVRTDRFIQQTAPEPYIGLGWNGDPFGDGRWRFSADVGSFVSTNGSSAPSLGLSPQTHGGGIHWTPYLSIGAQLSY